MSDKKLVVPQLITIDSTGIVMQVEDIDVLIPVTDFEIFTDYSMTPATVGLKLIIRNVKCDVSLKHDR